MATSLRHVFVPLGQVIARGAVPGWAPAGRFPARGRVRSIALAALLASVQAAGSAFPSLAGAPSRQAEPQRTLIARRHIVVSADPIASEVGSRILDEGGNAVDAAIAVGFALAVVYPQAGNLGGGGFLLYRDAASGASWVVDYRETAPARASPEMYLGPAGEPVKGLSTDGYLAVAVPGTPAGLELAHRRYGLLPWKRLVEPALRLANKGFPVSAALAEDIRNEAAGLGRYPSTAAVFLPQGRPPMPGYVLRQPDLARTLAAIASDGAAGFHRGRVARTIAGDVQANGGVLTTEDLAAYRARIRKPLEGTYSGLKLLTVPPP